MSLGKFRLKQQYDTTTRLLERTKSRARTTPNAGEDVEQWELSFVAAGDAEWYSRFRRRFASFSQNETYTYPVIQLHALVFTQRS